MTYTSVINILLTHFSDFENGLFKGIEALLNISTAPITNKTDLHPKINEHNHERSYTHEVDLFKSESAEGS